MNKIIFSCLIVGLFLNFSCINTNIVGSPDETMKGFIDKIKNQDFSAAKQYTTTNTDAMLDFLEIGINVLRETGKEDEITALFGGVDFSKVTSTCTIKDKKAICKCCENDTKNCKDFKVVQEGGKWLINIPKESTIE